MSSPTVTREDAAQLWKILRGNGFMQRKEIAMQPRMIRAVCQEHPQHFMSTQQGYKLVKEATPDEISNAIADLRSRCKFMEKRAAALEGVLNG